MAALAKYPTFDQVYNILDRNSAKLPLLQAIVDQFESHKGRLTKTQMDTIWKLIRTNESSDNQNRVLGKIFPDLTQRIKRMQAQLLSPPQPSPPSLSSFEIYFVEYNKLRGLYPQLTCQRIHDEAMTVISSPTHTPAIDLATLKPRLKKHWDCFSLFQKNYPAATEQQLHLEAMKRYKSLTESPAASNSKRRDASFNYILATIF